MMSKPTLFYLTALAALLIVIHLLRGQVKHLQQERNRYSANTEALLSDIKRMQIDSCTTAVTIQTLKLSANEYERFRTADATTIKKMGIRIKNLEAAAKHEVAVEVPVDATVRDTVIIRDSSAIAVQKVEMHTPFIQLSGLIQENRLTGHIHVPVTLQQAIWIEYKRHWIFFKRVKDINQTISSNNPHVRLKYSEFINIQK